MEKSMLVKCEPACPLDTDEEPSNFVLHVRNADDNGSVVKVESWTSVIPDVEYDPLYPRNEDVTVLENFELASGTIPLKQETKSELTESGPTQENTLERADIKDEIFTEEHTIDHLDLGIKEEFNVDNVVILTKGPLNTCGRCCKTFSRRSHLMRHLLTHTGVRPYCCTKCKRTFSQSVGLKRHMLIHNGVKPYRCTECSRTFREKCTLREHRLTHSGERPYHCNDCNNTYSRKSYLKAHLLTHSGERAHLCTICESTFALRTSLKKHMLTHSGERPYICIVCKSSFTRRFSLKRHLSTHCEKAETSFKCENGSPIT